MTTFETVVLGIISSLIATFVFLAIGWVGKHVVIPWFEDKIYRGVRIDGRWTLKLAQQPEEEYIFALELVQKADRVSGACSLENKESKEISVYRINGELANAYFNASLAPISKKAIDTGALVAHVYHEKGLRMSGVMTYISSKNGEVKFQEVILERADS